MRGYDTFDMGMMFVMGFVFTSLFWVGLVFSGVLDNRSTWTLSDIKAELELREETKTDQLQKLEAELTEIKELTR